MRNPARLVVARLLGLPLLSTLCSALPGQVTVFTEVGTFVGYSPAARLGSAVTIAGNTALAGAPFELVGVQPLGMVRPCRLAGTCQLVNPWFTNLIGSGANGSFGAAMANVGDINNDGRSDFIVGEPHATVMSQASRGQAIVYDGATGQAIWTLQGLNVSDQAGTFVASAGDVDGGGRNDLLVGAPNAVRADCGCTTGSAGQVHVFAGETGQLLASLTGQRCSGCVHIDERLGRALARLGPLSSTSSRAAFLVGSDVLRSVRAYTYANNALTLAWTVTSTLATFGAAVAGLSDMDGDGVNDFAVGIPGSALVELRSGSDGALLVAPVANPLRAPTTGARFGATLANVGDVDGGGKDDLLVGDPEARGTAGMAILYSGETQSALAVFHGAAPGDRFGAAVGGGDDVSGDRRADVIIGAPGAANGAGVATAYAFHCNLCGSLCGGSGCHPAQPANLPAIGFPSGDPHAGKAAFDVGLGNAYGATTGYLLIGVPIQVSGCIITPPWCPCSFLVNPWIAPQPASVQQVRGPGGMGSGVGHLTIPIPADPNLAGLQVSFQWIGPSPTIFTQRLTATIASARRLCP